jgi:uncharacterized protein (DUF1800 family)
MLQAATILQFFLAVAPAKSQPVWDEQAARHLLSRACMGGSPEQAKALASLPLHEAVDQLLDEAVRSAPAPRPSWARDIWVNKLRRYSDMPREEYLVTFRRASSRCDREMIDLKQQWMGRMASGPSPLLENMTFFWHGHFTTATSKLFAASQAQEQQLATWRKHALGNFKEFLKAATLDPAMMIYLDMEGSDRGNPNENYARELLELFALGVGNYTESDIRGIARALTGYSLDAPQGTIKPDRPTSPTTARSMSRDGLVPTFNLSAHDDGPKTVFGKTGPFGLDDVIEMVAGHPACGRHLAAKMCVYFGAHDPAGALRDRMATIYTTSKGEIKPMMRELLVSREFLCLEARGNRVKSPVRLIVGACRDLSIKGDLPASFTRASAILGQDLFNPPTVKGWPTGDDWITATTLSLRQRLGRLIVDSTDLGETKPLGRTRGTLVPRDPAESRKLIERLLAIDQEKAALAEPTAMSSLDRPALERIAAKLGPDELADHYLSRLLVVPPRGETRLAISRAVADCPPGDRPFLAVKLVIASPEYQME